MEAAFHRGARKKKKEESLTWLKLFGPKIEKQYQLVGFGFLDFVQG